MLDVAFDYTGMKLATASADGTYIPTAQLHSGGIILYELVLGRGLDVIIL